MKDAASKERTRNYLHQIKGAVVYKALAMAASFLTIPLMIHYLGQEQFGVWSTLLTVMSWVVFFDLGVGNGLRNKVAETLAKNERAEAANYISSGYSLIGLISLGLWAVSAVASFFIQWQTVFNTQSIAEATLRHTVQIALLFIVLNFWIGLIGALLGAVQKTSMTALGQLISNVLSLLLVYTLSKTTNASMSYLACVYGIAMVTANVILSIWFYRQYPDLRPGPHLNRQHVNPLLSVGLQFFTIQLAVLVIFTTDKMLITQLLGPQFVTQYEVVFRLFGLISLVHTLISAPLWSAYTEAYHRKDTVWIKGMLSKQLKILLALAAVALAMVFLAKPVISVWIGPDIEVAGSLVVAMGIFVIVSAWNNVFAMFVNGTGKIRPQLYTAVAAMILNIPLAILFAKYFSMGVSGIVLATSVSLLLAAVVLPIQVRGMIHHEKGIA